MVERKSEQQKFYIFWVGNIRYSGEIIDENETHWSVRDIKEGIIDIPKTAVRKEVQR